MQICRKITCGVYSKRSEGIWVWWETTEMASLYFSENLAFLCASGAADRAAYERIFLIFL